MSMSNEQHAKYKKYITKDILGCPFKTVPLIMYEFLNAVVNTENAKANQMHFSKFLNFQMFFLPKREKCPPCVICGFVLKVSMEFYGLEKGTEQ